MKVSREKWKTAVGTKVSLYVRYTVINVSWLSKRRTVLQCALKRNAIYTLNRRA